MPFKNKLTLLLCTVFIVISFSSCINKKVPVEESETTVTETTMNGSLKVMIGNEAETEIMTEIINRFTNIHNVNVSLITSKDESVTKIEAADMYIGKLDLQTYLNLALNNKLLELTNTDVLSLTNSECLEEFKINEKQYLMPISVNLKGLIINKDLFTKYNIPSLNEWENLFNMQDSITDQAVFPLQMYSSPINKSILIGKLLLQSELAELDEGFYRNLDLHDKEITKAVIKINELLNLTDKETLKYDYEQGLNEFASGRALMIFGDSEDINKLKFINPSLNLSFESYPLLSMDLYSGAIIMEDGENKEIAKMFLEFFVQENIADFYINSTNSYPVLNNVKNKSSEFSNINEIYGLEGIRAFYQSNSDYDNKLAKKFNEILEREGVKFRFQ